MKHARYIQMLALANHVVAILGCIYYPEYIVYGLIAWSFVNIFGTNIAYTDLWHTEVLQQLP